MYIPDLFDEYDRSWQAYNSEADENLIRAFELAQIDTLPAKNPHLFLPRFRDIANYIQQPGVKLTAKFAEIKGTDLTQLEQEVLVERINYAKIWIEKYAPDQYRQQMTQTLPQEAEKLTQAQKTFLKHIIALVEKESSGDQLQQELYEAAKSSGLAIKDAFASIYLLFLGKTQGPRAGSFLRQYPKEKVVERLKQVNE
jgi:lysyl-tRNA synthetase class 1